MGDCNLRLYRFVVSSFTVAHHVVVVTVTLIYFLTAEQRTSLICIHTQVVISKKEHESKKRMMVSTSLQENTFIFFTPVQNWLSFSDRCRVSDCKNLTSVETSFQICVLLLYCEAQ